MTELQLPGSLVSVAWLDQHLGHDQLLLFDASWHMPAAARDGYLEWQQAHIPGARFFDFDRRICATNSELPHMMPDAATFTRELQALGLNRDSKVVVYDVLGMVTSPRAWWMLKAMGFNNVALLDGGMPAWNAAGLPVGIHSGTAVYEPGNFDAQPVPAAFVDSGDVLKALADERGCVIDARPAARFNGEVDEPRAGLRRGHMPGALSLPFADLFDQGLLKSKAELSELILPLTADNDYRIFSCGSGVTACVLAFAADYIGLDGLAVYDGSWSEWGLPSDLPVVADQGASD